MKKTVAVASVCTTLFSAASVVNAEEMITTENLNIREKPTTTAAKLGILSKNTTINVTSISNGWGKFQYKGQTAYVTAEYLKKKENTQVSTTKKYIVNTTVLNVRSQATASSTKIGSVYEGDELAIIKKESNGWYKIKHEGKTGYVSGDYVTVKDVTNSSTPLSSSQVDKTKTYTVNTDVLNVRDKAGTHGKQIGQ
ncbi:MAG: SH3 domain-containing protein, partial [Bacillaceae bacterium]